MLKRERAVVDSIENGEFLEEEWSEADTGSEGQPGGEPPEESGESFEGERSPEDGSLEEEG